MKRTISITAITIVVSVVATTLAIDAADTLQGKGGTLLSSVVTSNERTCPEGMVPVSGVTFACVDAYEASPNADCPRSDTANPIDSKDNLDDPDCRSISRTGALPWVNVSREQARALCARRDARLPTNAEWYAVAAGMRDVKNACNTSSGSVEKTGTRDACATEAGVRDLIGNVWEWTSDDAIDGSYDGRALPESGYIAQVDQSGVVIASAQQPDALFSQDYAWTAKAGAFGMLRGGFYGSMDDAGVFTLHAATLPTAPSAGIGFRCVQ